MSRPTLANLERELANIRRSANQMRSVVWRAGGTNPMNSSAYYHHSNLVAQARRLEARIARRREANAARAAAANARGRRLARQAGRYWRNRTMRPPSGNGNAGGVTYRRLAAQTNVGNGISNRLRQQLARLRVARDSGNRGNMVNIYNSMGRNWEEAGGIHGANIMNNAQKIMFRSRLIM
jgi:hypothetical protein